MRARTATSGHKAEARLRQVARTGAVLAVALSPWLFGSADPWAYLTVCLIAACAALTPAATAAEANVREFLAKSGLSRGICVVLGDRKCEQALPAAQAESQGQGQGHRPEDDTEGRGDDLLADTQLK